MDREAERFRMAKDPTAYSLNDFKNDFPELVQLSKDSINVLHNNGYRVVYEDYQNAFFVSDVLGGSVLR